MITYPGAMEHLGAEDIAARILEPFDHVHISSIFLQPLILKNLYQIFELIKSKGLTVSCDPQWDPAEKWGIDLHKLLPLLDIFLPNINELKAISQCDSLNEVVEKYGSLSEKIIVKDGENGSYWFEEQKFISSPPFLNNSVVDCIGAGDSYNAGFIYQFILNNPRGKCAEFGSIIGAINTTAPGGTSAFQDMDVIRKTAKEIFGYDFNI